MTDTSAIRLAALTQRADLNRRAVLLFFGILIALGGCDAGASKTGRMRRTERPSADAAAQRQPSTAAQLPHLRAQGKWAEYIDLVCAQCYASPPPVWLRLPELMNVVNNVAAWYELPPIGLLDASQAGLLHTSQPGELPTARAAWVLFALDRLARSTRDAAQASEAQYAAALLVDQIWGPEAAAAVWKKLASQYPDTPSGEAAAIEAWQYEHLHEGASLADISWTTAAGAEFDLDEITEPLLIYCWISKCGPCDAQSEVLRQAFESGGSGTRIVAINFDSKRAVFEEGRERIDLTAEHVFIGDQPVDGDFRVAGFPTVFLVSGDDVIRQIDPSREEITAWLKGTDSRAR